MFEEIIQKTLRVPLPDPIAGNSKKLTMQLDITLLSVGFKLSKELFEALSSLHPSLVLEISGHLLFAVRKMVGDDVTHNTYFLCFPEGVPDTLEFWWTEIFRFLTTGQTHYGRYQHSYAKMIAAHDEFIPSLKDRLTLLHPGKSIVEETRALYYQLIESNIPLNTEDRQLVEKLAELCIDDPQPEIPVRETKAIINAVRFQYNKPILVDTITDMLRMACALSSGDVTLVEKTPFHSFPRAWRKRFLFQLSKLVHKKPESFFEIGGNRERWKRLAERLKPHEYSEYTAAQEVFLIARNEKKISSPASKIAQAFVQEDIKEATKLLLRTPGVFFRSLDHLLREVAPKDETYLLKGIEYSLPHCSSRVLLSLREHLENRRQMQEQRIFTNSKGRAWVTAEERAPLKESLLIACINLLDRAIEERLPIVDHLLVQPEMLQVAIPLSNKNMSSGFSIMPKGSTFPVEDGILRFFVYWKQKVKRTDYDLSALILDENFKYLDHVSYTRLQALGGVHSGDLTEAEHGATEFIDLDLRKVPGNYLIPTINIFAGEDFTEVQRCFFGMMHRLETQKGKPFEPTTVRLRSDVNGSGKVALPIIFLKNKTGEWEGKWIHLFLKGQPQFNRIESTHLTTSLLVRSFVEREYLTVAYLVERLKAKGTKVSRYKEGMDLSSFKGTLLCFNTPEHTPKSVTLYTAQTIQNVLSV